MKSPLTIHLNNITYSIQNTLLYHQTNLSLIGNKVIGLIGPNGSGKSTLFKLIMKKAKPDNGHVTVVGDLGYLPQELEFSHTVTVRGYLSNFIAGDREEYKILAVLDKLDMSNIQQDHIIGNLSGGQQRKIGFARLLLQECSILLLDEPTNHIDTQTQSWLVSFLSSFKGMIVIISHDRALLNEVCSTIVEVADQQIHVYDGNYDDYKIEKENLYQHALADHATWLKRKRKTELRLADMRVRASAHPNPALGRLIRSREKYIEREIISKESHKPTTEKTLTTSLAGGTHRGKFILNVNRNTDGIQQLVRELYAVPLPLPDSQLQSSPKRTETELYGTDRLLISGPNGSGKSTLLRAIGRHITGQQVHSITIKQAPEIHICIVDQHLKELHLESKVLDEFVAKAGAGNRDERLAKSILQQFGLPESSRRQRVKDLSYGQRVRLRFAQISTNAYDLLILDEPTNHLDIATREVIEQALIDYEGALIVVSHDQYFIQQLMITQTIEL